MTNEPSAEARLAEIRALVESQSKFSAWARLDNYDELVFLLSERDAAYRRGIEEAALTRLALEESVRLQAHYAALLNQYDGGKRIVFASANEWIARLRALTRPAEPPGGKSP